MSCEPLNIKTFGAKGDGITDDTIAVQACVAAAIIAKTGVTIPTGEFLIASTNGNGAINIDGPLSLFGTGASSVLRLKAGSTGFVIRAYNSTPFSGLVLRDFTVDGNAVATAQLDAGLVQIQNISHFLVDNLEVRNGTRASGASGINGIAVSDSGTNVTSGSISNCLVENCSKGLINWTTNARGGRIIGNTCRNGTGNGLTPGIQINGGMNVVVSHNQVYGNQGSGILVATDGNGVGPEHAIICNNHIYSNGQGVSQGAGIRLARGYGSPFGRIIIANNVIHSNGVNVNDSGIVLIDDQQVTVTGNHIYNNRLAAIAIGGSVNAFSDLNITGNTFENNNQGGTSAMGIIYAVGSISRVVIKCNRFVDTQAVSTMSYAIYTAAGSYAGWLVEGNQITGHVNPQAVFFDTGTPAAWSSSVMEFSGATRTTDASNVNVGLMPVADNTMVVVRVKALGVKSGGGDRAYYDKELAMYRNGGGLTALGAVASHYDQESDATWSGATALASGNTALARVSGKVSTAIDWMYTVRCEWK